MQVSSAWVVVDSVNNISKPDTAKPRISCIIDVLLQDIQCLNRVNANTKKDVHTP